MPRSVWCYNGSPFATFFRAIKTPIAIAGGRPRGTLYGVYTFLEDYLGVRFLTPEHTHVPDVGDKRVVGPVDYNYSPPLSFRHSSYGEINRNPVFASRMRCNTKTKDAKFGGITGRHQINHTFSRQVPTSRYGKAHPEYFTLRDGKRISNVKNDSRHTQLCTSNPEVLRIITESVLAEIAADSQRTNVSVNARAKGIDKNCFAHARNYAIDDAIGKAALDAIAEAEALADSDAVRTRVEKAKIWALRAAIGDLPKRLSCGMRDQWSRREITLKDFPTMDQADIDRKRPHMREMFALYKKHGVDRWSEGWTIKDAMPVFRKFFGLKEGEEF
ncbi:MAG: DUF4838 domain-containing protein [Pirellulales bacterium]|nr:DUF4838 domain-containing protein [Pirellulales bacterium]